MPDAWEGHDPNVPSLEDQLRQLVERYGLPRVYKTIKGNFDFCDNCGTPYVAGEVHVPANLGMCYINKARKGE